MLLWLAIPLLIGGLIMSLAGGSGGPKPTGLLLITDLDDSLLSGFVAGAYSQGELGELLLVEKVSAEEGLARIEAGEASGFLTIPEGFQDALLDSEPVTLQLKTNPAQTILPGIITDVTEILLDAGFYLEQLLGDEIREIQAAADGEAVDEVFVADIAMAIQKKMASAETMLFPPIIDLTVAEPPPEEPGVPFALLYLPGIVLMALMFSANGLAGDYWKERDQGTLRRLVSSPVRLTGFIAGKTIAAGVVMALIGLVTLTLGFLYQDVSFARMPASIAWVMLSGMALFAWFGFLQMLAPSQHSGELLTSMMLFPLLMMGGSFFPLAALPGWLAAIGEKLPNGFMAERLTAEITAASGGVIEAGSWGLIAAFAAAGIALKAWRLRSGFARR